MTNYDENNFDNVDNITEPEPEPETVPEPEPEHAVFRAETDRANAPVAEHREENVETDEAV